MPAMKTRARDVPRPRQGGIDIATFTDEKPTRGTFLVYGRSGAGKTHFAGTFPTPLFVDMRGGMETVRKKQVSFTRPKTYLDILSAAVPEHVVKYKTIVLDHFTECARILTAEVLEDAKREIPQLQDWMLVIERMRRILTAFAGEDSFPDKHIVFCAEETSSKDELTGEVVTTIAAPGQLKDDAPTYFDCVFHLRNCFNPQTKSKGRWALTEPDGRFQDAKDRFGVLDKLEVPDFNHIWGKIHG